MSLRMSLSVLLLLFSQTVLGNSEGGLWFTWGYCKFFGVAVPIETLY